jgi:(+)-trans-carveol dehydrogenase
MAAFMVGEVIVAIVSGSLALLSDAGTCSPTWEQSALRCGPSASRLRAGGRGGSIVLTSSALGIRAMPTMAHYVAAKAGVIGLMRVMALELAADKIRVNSVHPSIVDSLMVQNAATYGLFMPDVDGPAREQAAEAFATLNPMPTPWVAADDVANAVLFLASDEARLVTGLEMKLDAGFCLA